MGSVIRAFEFYRYMPCYAVVCILLMTAFRIAGIALFLPNSQIDEISGILKLGLVTDIAVAGWILVPAALLTFVTSWVPEELAIILRKFEFFYQLAALLLIFVLEMASFAFVFLTGYRPGDLVFDDIPGLQAVMAVLFDGRILITLGIVAAALVGFMVFARLVHHFMEEYPPVGVAAALCPFAVVCAVLFGAVTGIYTGDYFDRGRIFFSFNRISNTLASNSLYALASGWLERKPRSFVPAGDSIPPAAIVSRLRQDTGFDYSPAYRDSARPTMNYLVSDFSGRRPNIILIVRPSWGERFVRSLGGQNVSSNFDRLCFSGLCMLNMYAVSLSSTANLEALTSSAVPSRFGPFFHRAGTSGFYSIVRELKKAGYSTSFVFGDRGVSAEMSAYLERSGYDRVIGYSGLAPLLYDGINGAGDEDIYAKALETFDRAAETGAPFFGVIKTNSGRHPYDYPISRVPPFSPENEDDDLNAVNYADIMMGNFFASLKKTRYYGSTVIIVTGDHGQMRRDSSLIPFKSFRIPAAIFARGLSHRFERRTVSQIDIPKTVLNLAGVSAAVPMTGYDLLNMPEGFAGRALIRYEGLFSYLRTSGLAGILRPGGRPVTMMYSSAEDTLLPERTDTDINELALCYASMADRLLDLTWYDVVPENAPQGADAP